LWNPASRQLLRRYRDGEAGIDGYAEDYAFLVFGLLELFQADGDVRWLDWAVELQAAQDERFWDPADAGWFSTTGHDPTVLLRLKEDHDGAEPAATSVSVLNVLTLAHLIPSDEATKRVERTLARLGPRIGNAARVVPMLLCGLSAWHGGLSQIVIAGAAGAESTRTLKRELAARFLPFAIVIPIEPGSKQDALAARLPFLAAMTAGGDAAAYVCREFTCQQPVTRADELAAVLSR
jgi:uncharacterized protein YyaL (SSP411 family)